MKSLFERVFAFVKTLYNGLITWFAIWFGTLRLFLYGEEDLFYREDLNQISKEMSNDAKVIAWFILFNPVSFLLDMIFCMTLRKQKINSGGLGILFLGLIVLFVTGSILQAFLCGYLIYLMFSSGIAALLVSLISLIVSGITFKNVVTYFNFLDMQTDKYETK